MIESGYGLLNVCFGLLEMVNGRSALISPHLPISFLLIPFIECCPNSTVRILSSHNTQLRYVIRITGSRAFVTLPIASTACGIRIHRIPSPVLAASVNEGA